MTNPKIGDVLRLRKRQLFQKLGYTPHAGQELVHRSKAARRVLACGSRWGKSKCATMEAIAALMEPRETALGWLVAPTYDLTDRIFKQVMAIIRTRFAHRVIEFAPREHRVVVRNLGGGVSELRAKSADRPESLLGEALDFLVIDESASLRENVWEGHLAPRLIDRHGWSLLLSTPKGCNWFWEQFQRGKRDPAYECWQAPSTQNPHVDAREIEAERARLTEEVFNQQYAAAFIGHPLLPCRACGGPGEGIESWIILQPDEEPRRCSACDGYVHKSGGTAVGIVNGALSTTLLVEDGRPYAEGEIAELDVACRM